MTVAVMMTKAEKALIEGFASVQGQLPRDKAMRARAMADFQEVGLPHRRVEAWKYTDLKALLKDIAPPAAGQTDVVVDIKALEATLEPWSALNPVRLVFVDGQFAAALSSDAAGVSFSSLATAVEQAETQVHHGDIASEAVVALNRALASDGAVIDVPAGARIERPLLIVHAASGENPLLVSLRHRIKVGEGAAVTIIETDASPNGARGQANTLISLEVGPRAQVQHVQVNATHADRAGILTNAVTLDAECGYRLFQVTAHAPLVRNQSFITFAGENSAIDVSGLMIGEGKEHCDTTLVIDHAVPNCESRELFKAVLDDQARAVFQGKVIVRPDAQKTDGKQMANALMLSPDTEFNAKPELEIYADDVVCGHGATIAELDPHMMFYLRSRGIPVPEARALLIESFVGETFEKIEHEGLREAISEVALAALAKVARKERV